MCWPFNFTKTSPIILRLWMSQLYPGGSGTRCHCHFRKTSLYLLKQAKEGLKRIKLTKMEWGMSLCQNCTKGKQKKLQLQISNGNNNQKFMEIICLPLVYNQSPHFNQLQLWRPSPIQNLYLPNRPIKFKKFSSEKAQIEAKVISS